MKKRAYPILLSIFACLLFVLPIFAQPTCAEAAETPGYFDSNQNLVIWFGILELPFLLLCIIYSFRTAVALRGGIFGKGMNLLAWGFLVMAVGHLAMQITHITGFDIFRDVLGNLPGSITWFIALMVTWSLSAIGFYQIHKVSRQA